MHTLVGDYSDTQSFIQPTDSYATLLNDPTICGKREYQFVPPQPFLTIIEPENPFGGEPIKLILQTKNMWRWLVLTLFICKLN